MRGSVAFEPGYNVGISVGNCSLTAMLTTSSTTSAPGDKTRSLPVTADTNTRNSRLEPEKGVPLHTPILFNLVQPSPVSTLRHEQASQEGEGLRPRCSPVHRS